LEAKLLRQEARGKRNTLYVLFWIILLNPTIQSFLNQLIIHPVKNLALSKGATVNLHRMKAHPSANINEDKYLEFRPYDMIVDTTNNHQYINLYDSGISTKN
jgi:hypothetical protein